MSVSPNLTLLLIGAGAGLTVALIGGLVEYWVSMRANGSAVQHRLPGCLFYVSGGLALAGIIAIAASVLFNRGIEPALVIGAGVLGGFYLGFAFLFALWFLVERQ